MITRHYTPMAHRVTTDGHRWTGLTTTLKAGQYSSEDIHCALFSTTPTRRTIEAMKRGIRQYVRKRHAGR
jgi:hypothetical protein